MFMQFPSRLRFSVKARPLNCAPEIGDKVRCPRCKQFHLRPGYCQALDPINADKYPEVWAETAQPVIGGNAQNHGVETDVTDNLQPEVENATDNQANTDNFCDVCGKSFLAKRRDARFCSAACRKQRSRELQAKYL